MGFLSPYIGTVWEVSEEAELKVEVTCRMDRLDETIAAVKKSHPYEEPMINVISLIRTGQ